MNGYWHLPEYARPTATCDPALGAHRRHWTTAPVPSARDNLQPVTTLVQPMPAAPSDDAQPRTADTLVTTVHPAR